MAPDDLVLNFLYWFTITAAGLIALGVCAFFVFGSILFVIEILKSCVSTCRNRLRARSQENQGNELSALPTSNRGPSGARPVDNAANSSSIPPVPTQQ